MKEKENNEKFLNRIEKEKKNNEELFDKINKEKKYCEEFLNKIKKENNNESLNKIENENEIINKIKDIIKIQLRKCNLQNINSIKTHKDCINSVSIFPSGNIISVSNDKSIIIYDINLNILQNIQNAHNDYINYVEVIDENNFITCSEDKSIKLWIKNNNEYIINKSINNAHEKGIYKVIYCSNGNIISCSYNKIKIWQKNNNNYYESIKILTHSDWVYSILFLEDKNILISSGLDGTKFWNLNKNEINYNNINCIKYFEDIYCYNNNGLCRLDEDRIIIGGDNSLKIISISNKIIIKEINIPFKCWGILLIEDKGIFLIGGYSNDIMIYRNDNYECIQIIQNAHDYSILGFVKLKDESIISYSNDKNIKKWKI